MSKKRSKTAASRDLRAAIDGQLAAAAREIFRLLQERADGDPEQLRPLVAERVAAAVEGIFTVFQEIRGARAAEEPGERWQRNRTKRTTKR